MRTFLSDVRYGLRGLGRRPGFTLAAVLALALGLGANTAIFSVVDAVVLSPLPYADPDRLVTLWETNAAEGLDRERLSPVNFLDYRALDRVFADAAAWWQPEINLTDEQGDPVRVTTIEVSGNFFSVLGVAPRLGRGFPTGGELHGDEPEVVISHRLWQSRYGGDPTIVGKAVRLDGDLHTVVGVMPPGFNFPRETDVWQRLSWNLARHSRYAHFMEAVARLRPGMDPKRAQTELAALAEHLRQEHAASNKDWGARLVPLQAEVVGNFRPALLVLLAAVGLLLLMACANVAHLLLARATAREREVAIRAALGANRGRLLRQFLTESLLLALFGGALGLALAWAVLELLVATKPLDIPRLAEVAIDGRVLAFGAGATLLTVILFGLVPALQMSGLNLQGTLKEGGRGASSGPAARRARSVLVVLEVTTAVVLLIGAGLLIRSFLRLLAERPGFEPAGVVTVNVQLPPSAYEDWGQVSRFYTGLLDALQHRPGVRTAGATGFLPLEPGWLITYTLPDRPVSAGDEPTAQFVTATPGYFETLRVPLLAGRTFNTRDTAESPLVVVVNRELARRAWGEERAIGKTLVTQVRNIGPLGRMIRDEGRFEIVGVVDDVKNNALQNEVEPAVYFPHTQFPYRNMNLVVRGTGEAGALAGVIRTEVRRLDPGLALSEVRTLDQVLAASRAQPRFLMFLMTAFAGLALFLAALGIYGVLSYAVHQRRGEIGVRLALGATPARIRNLVLREGMGLIALGLALGFAAAYTLARFLASLLFGVSTSDALTFAAVPAVILGVALFASLLPAQRAAQVDPLEALRAE